MCEIEIKGQCFDVAVDSLLKPIGKRDLVVLKRGEDAGKKGIVLGLDDQDVYIRLTETNDIKIIHILDLELV